MTEKTEHSVEGHLDHPEMLEVYFTGVPLSRIVVECVRCGVEVAEIYNVEKEDD